MNYLYFFGSRKIKDFPHNVFVGGVTVSNAADIAILFNAEGFSTPLNPMYIKDFEIFGDAFSAHISEEVPSFIEYFPERFVLGNARYIIDKSHRYGLNSSTGFNQQMFENSTSAFFASHYGIGQCGRNLCFTNSTIPHLFFENATITGRQETYKNYNPRGLRGRVYIPNAKQSAANSNSFDTSKETIFYLPANVSNSIQNQILNFPNNIVRLIQNTTKPSSVNDLSFTNLNAKNVTLNFTEISNADFYEVWIYDDLNEKVWRAIDEIQGTNSTIELPKNLTNYSIKITTCDQYWNGSGYFIDEQKKAFSNEINLTTL